MFPRILLSRIFVSSCSLSLVVSACAAEQSRSDHSIANPRGDRCDHREPPAPNLAALPEAVLPESKLWLGVDVPTVSIMTRLKQSVPAVLARERDQPVGAPGRATYTVRRGEPRLSTSKAGFELHVPVSADISVCKPIGSSCFKYGHCSPDFDATFSFDVRQLDRYSLAPPRGSIRATSKCVIGIDVTRQLESVANKELTRVERQVARRWPDTLFWAEQGWRGLSQPVPLSDAECLIFEAKETLLNGPRLVQKGSRLRAGVGVTGVLRQKTTCESSPDSPPLPPPKFSGSPFHTSQVWIPELVSMPELEQAIQTALSGTWSQVPGDDIEVLEVRFFERGAFLKAKLRGRLCETRWIKTELVQVAGEGLHLAATTVQSSSTATGAPSAGVEADLTAHIGGKLLRRTQGDVWTDQERISSLLRQLQVFAPEGIELSVEVKEPESARIILSKDGVFILHSIKASIKLKNV